MAPILPSDSPVLRHLDTILITGFEPFGGDVRNPSAEIAQALNGRRISRHLVVGATLSCRFGVARRELDALVRRHRPGLVICLGLASERKEITPERVALNVDDARLADNGGRRPVDCPIEKRGPVAYWSGLPVKAIVAALRRRQIPASVSQTAGTFVCNHVFYALMHRLRRRPEVRGGFIHVPWPADWAGRGGSTITFAEMVSAIESAVSVCLRSRPDDAV